MAGAVLAEGSRNVIRQCTARPKFSSTPAQPGQGTRRGSNIPKHQSPKTRKAVAPQMPPPFLRGKRIYRKGSSKQFLTMRFCNPGRATTAYPNCGRQANKAHLQMAFRLARPRNPRGCAARLAPPVRHRICSFRNTPAGGSPGRGRAALRGSASAQNCPRQRRPKGLDAPADGPLLWANLSRAAPPDAARFPEYAPRRSAPDLRARRSTDRAHQPPRYPCRGSQG